MPPSCSASAGERALGIARDAGVVTGREPGGAERVRELEHRVEAHLTVAANARVRGQAGRVAVEELVDNAGAKALAQVERQVREPHVVGQPAGAEHGLRRAAALVPIRGGVGPQLERDGDHLVARVERELRGGRAVDPAAHRDERPPRARAQLRNARLGDGPESAVKSVRGKLRDVPLGPHEPAQSGIDFVGADPGGVQEGAALDELDDGAAGGGERTAALGVEARLRDPVALDAHAHAHEVTAGGTARETRVGSVGETAPAGWGVEMLGKGAQDETYAIARWSCSGRSERAERRWGATHRKSPTLLNRAKTKQPKEEAPGSCSAHPGADDAGMRRFAAG